MEISFTRPVLLVKVLVLLLLTTSGTYATSYAQSNTDLHDYVGSFEGRDISLSGTTLYYKRDGMPTSVSMQRIETDHFKIIVPPGARVRGPGNGQIPTFRFNRNDAGDVVSLSMVTPDNTILGTYQKSSSPTQAVEQDNNKQLPSVDLPPALEQVLRDYEKAWQEGQNDVLAGLFVDAGFVTSNEGWIRGRKAIQQKYASTSGDLRLRAVDYDVDASIGYIVGAFGYGEQAVDRDLGMFVLVLRKSEEGNWLIVADIDKFNRQ